MREGAWRGRTFIGTLGYMAPEMLREQKTSAKVDQFSYGVVVWSVPRRPTRAVRARVPLMGRTCGGAA
jgi:serine/threonine protein kinase